MSKIICDICGTTYQDTADCCPICGCSRDTAGELLAETASEEILEDTVTKAGKFAPKKREIFDFDEVNADPAEEEEDEDDEDEDYDEEEEEEEVKGHNTFVVILLTILIVGLLTAAGFIFVRYFLPNMQKDEVPVSTTVATQAAETVPQETSIPCEQLSMSNISVAELNEIGQQFLLHIQVQPENTTDKIIFTSADESIATVTEDGRITAVSEGETKIFISCGKVSNECPVIVKFVEETVPPTTEAPVIEETAPATVQTEPIVAETTAPATNAPSSDVKLKLKKTDIRLGVYLQFTLELDCALEQNQVEWTSEHPHIAKVDENGVVTAVKSGTTAIIAKYGDQEVQCIVRCFVP